jgi:hypothetical protein
MISYDDIRGQCYIADVCADGSGGVPFEDRQLTMCIVLTTVVPSSLGATNKNDFG